MHLQKFLIILSFLYLVGDHFLLAQVPEDSAYLKENIVRKTFDNAQWNSLKKELNYYDDIEPEYKEQTRNYTLPFSINSIYIKSFLFIFAAAVLVYVLIKLFKKVAIKNVKVAPTEFTIDTIEQDIHNADLENFLKGAIENKDYKQMVRIYYLIVIRELSNKKLITWKKDKTNHQYVQEMTLSDDYKTFKNLTNYFEFMWYSEKLFSEQQYLIVSEQFNKYIEKLDGKVKF